MASTSSSEVSHPVVFSTQTQYPLPTQKFMIPASWRRYQLSQLVNKALSLTKPVPFDFLVRGEILRTTLGEWCAEHGVEEEETLEIEYIESVMPPQRMTSLPHEDWVSSISCQESGLFLTASYDGNVRLFDYSQTLLQTVPVHSAAITSATYVKKNGENTRLVATASHDLTARLAEISVSPVDPSPSRVVASLHLHTGPLTGISANTSGSQLLTSSADGLIGLWDTSIPKSDEVPLDDAPSERKKRRKLDEGQEARPKRKAPVAVLKSHTARVSKALFTRDGKSAVSAGFDSTVRTWDVENGVCTSTITAAAKPFVDIALPHSGNTVLAASTDRTVSQYDLRAAESSAVTAAITSLPHPATPSCIAVPSAGSSEHQLVTGAYDGVVRLWDLRSAKSAVTSFKVWDARPASGRKILSVDWAPGVVGIGGEGGVEVWRVGEGDRLPAQTS
ncbi:NLE and WD40 domain-containing protein [Phanerochaete sordida]|uniref:Ribosome biogenesis protein YTM1 n=1 Tax=Phanerochaete sordida TaxID=48140 RepID=A0A9P3LGC0_9APHY|nr:NLE and WD40 domain-containing protein [Phanerochaete sordida]